jgi:hypothetical protein
MSTIQDFDRRVEEVMPAPAYTVVVGRFGTVLSRRIEARRRSARAAAERMVLGSYESPFVARWVSTGRHLQHIDSHRGSFALVRLPAA